MTARGRSSRLAALALFACPRVGHTGEIEDRAAAPLPPAAEEGIRLEQELRERERVEYLVPTLHTLGLFALQRTAESILFPDPFSRSRHFLAHYEEAFTKPPLFDDRYPAFRWDHDHWEVNLIGHGLMGSEIYLRARQCHFSLPGALAFTALSSTVWEYGFEANSVRPSAQDLVYTPLMGLALGELRFLIFKAASGSSRGALRAIVDPFGEIERALGSRC